MELIKNPLVCFFDSGIGGLGLLYECVRRLPRVDFIYYADNYRVPYGNLSKEEILKFTEEKFEKINEQNPSAAVVACNTVTACCIKNLREKYSFEILGIQPAVKPAAACGGKCLVLATRATSESESLKNLVKEYGNDNTEIFACVGLADSIEKNIFDISPEEMQKYLPDKKADSIVLGCTHYGFVKDIIENRYKCPVFDGISGTADNLMKKLGIFDHCTVRAQKITFIGGDSGKNRAVFNMLLREGGLNSQKQGN